MRKQLHLWKFIALSAISMLLFNTWSLELTGGQENVYAMEKSPAVQSEFDYSPVFDATFMRRCIRMLQQHTEMILQECINISLLTG